MTNKEILTNCILLLQPNFYTISTKYKIDPDLLLNTFTKMKGYNLSLEIGKSAGTVSKLLKELFPHREKTCAKVHSYVLSEFGLKYCSGCNTIKEVSEFRLNNTKRDGLQGECKKCHYVGTKLTQTERSSTYRCSKLYRTPKWADITSIAEFYLNCPAGYHVDHIIPLQGDIVCGLHVITNLQYLPASDNLSKSNKFTILDTP